MKNPFRTGGRGRAAAPEGRERARARPRRLLLLGVNVLLGLILIAGTLLLFPPIQPKPRYDKYKLGYVTQSGEEVIAPLSFRLPLKPALIEEQRAAASLDVAPIYEQDLRVPRQLRLKLAKLRQDLEAIRSLDASETLDQKVDRLLGLQPALERSALRVLLEKEGRLPILETVAEAMDSFLARGILDTRRPLLQSRAGEERLRVLRSGEEHLIDAERVVDQEDLTRLLEQQAGQLKGWDRESRAAFQSLARAHLRPNYFFDPEETALRKHRAATEVEDHVIIAKGVRILGPNVQVTQDHLDMLAALEAEQGVLRQSPWQQLGLYAGRALILAFLLAMMVRFLMFYDPEFFRGIRPTLLLCILILVFLAASKYALRAEGGAYLLPITFMAMLVAGLYEAVLAMMCVILSLSMLAAVGSPPVGGLLAAFLAGAAAIFSMRHLRSRLQLYKSVLYIAMAYIASIFALHLATGEMDKYLGNALLGLTNGLVCAWLVMPILPLLERFFDLTTDFTLLELTDLNRPILKRMKVEAPGTFQHSLVVSNLAEAAADAIGANALLAKVCAYYHDIGKLAKPEYFAENVRGFRNKHDKLSPNMSTLIVSAHVKEGLDLAEQIKLPSIVRRGIPEHHGTTVMRYFYHKAKESDPHGQVREDDFRYPGPKPQSAETAILMLADSIEATVRSLEVPNTSNIRAVVKENIEKRLQEGQLEECGLSISDLAKIRESFVTSLLAIHHPRIQYPAERDKAGDGEAGGEKKEREAPHAPENPAESEVSRGG